MLSVVIIKGFMGAEHFLEIRLCLVRSKIPALQWTEVGSGMDICGVKLIEWNNLFGFLHMLCLVYTIDKQMTESSVKFSRIIFLLTHYLENIDIICFKYFVFWIEKYI